MNSRPVFFQISRNRKKAASAPAMRAKALSGSIAKYSRGLALSALALIGASQAPGATYYWDTDGSGTPGFGTASGNWGSSAFWGTSDLGTGATANTTITASDTVNFGTATVGLRTGGIDINFANTVVNNIVFGSASGSITLRAFAGTSIKLDGTTPTITVNNLQGTILTALVGNAGLIKDGAGTLILSGDSKTYTGTTTVSAGTLQWSGNGGSNLGSTAYILNGSSSLVIDNTGGSRAGNDDRINNSATIALNGGSFTYIGSGSNQQSINEIVGAISGTGSSATAGSSITVTAPSQGGQNIQTTLTAASFTHSPGNASILVNGARLGQDTLTVSGTGVPRFILSTAPTGTSLVGTTSALTTGNGSNGLGLGAAKDTKIVPFLVGEATSTTGGLGTATGTPNTFLTYNSGTGLRPLNPFDEFTQNAITSGNNTRITTATAASSTVPINSLVIAGADLTIDDNQTLTNTSGAILFTSTNAIKPSGSTGALAFGSAEGMVRVNSGITGTISAVVTGSNGLTQSGVRGTLVLSGANSYTGTTTVSGGTTLNIRNDSALGSNTATTVASGGKLQLQGGISVGSGTTLTISQPTVSTFAYSSITNGTATTGTATNNGVYNLLTFTSIASSGTSASLDVTSAGAVDYLVVGGGGGGGYAAANAGGGGGAGGFRTNVAGNLSGGGTQAEAPLTPATGSYTVTVGAGGAGATSSAAGLNGGNTAFGSIISLGGGGGGSAGSFTQSVADGQSGGSGGGSAARGDGQTPNGVAGSGTSGQGLSGGTYAPGGDNGGGGGGGASGVGGTASTGGTGGAGLTSTITGTAVTLAGGGGGGHYNTFAVAGGAGGGGNGGGFGVNATAGTANTGGGGGGGGRGNNSAGGGSGIVILRYVGAALENVSGDNTFSGAITLGSSIGISSLAGTLTLGGAIGDSSSGYGITTLGAGTVALSVANTYTGATSVLQGTLKISASNALGTATNNITVASGGKLQFQSGIAVPSAKTLIISQPTMSTFTYDTLVNGTATSYGVNNVLTFNASGSLIARNAGAVEYLVIGGGGGGAGGSQNQNKAGGGGGGAGGYRSSVVGEFSGGNTAALSMPTLTTGAYTIGVGAGGAGGASGYSDGTTTSGNKGADSFIQNPDTTDLIRAEGGGFGAYRAAGGAGGSGGGTGDDTATSNGGAGTANQGFNGGNENVNRVASGGGGAGALGGNTSGNFAGNGGAGIFSSITGTSVQRGGGGGGSVADSNAYTRGLGGAGGGGNAGAVNENPGVAGTVNTGGGGGGGTQHVGGAGGSGVVILRYVGAALENVSGDNTFSGAITLGSSIGISSLAGTLTLGGAIGDSGSGYGITKVGNGTLALPVANTYAGATSILQGTLEVTANDALGTIAAGTTVASGATLKLTGVNYSTAEGLIINGTGVSSGGALASSGTSTFAGLITAATSATINAISGTLELSGGLVKDGTTLTFTGAGAFTISSVISGASANSDLVVDATTVTLTEQNTYNGPTTITNGGTLIANALGALPLSPRSAVSFTGSGNPTLNLGASQEVASLSSSTTSAVVNLSATGTNTLTVGAASGTTTFTGSIGGTSGNLIKDGASTQVLTGTNNTYTGTTTVSAGTLEVQGSLSGTTGVTVNTGGTLLMNSAASDIVKTTATVAMAGGTLAFGNAANQTQNLGAMTLTANSTLDFGASDGNDKFLFAGFVHTAGTLAITNWVGNDAGGTDGLHDRLVFTGLFTDFTSSFSQAQISFNGSSGYAAINFGGTSYEIVPVPEPATTALIGSIALCALVGYRERRRFTGLGKRTAARK